MLTVRKFQAGPCIPPVLPRLVVCNENHRGGDESEQSLLPLRWHMSSFVRAYSGIGDPGEEAFYRVAEEGLVLYDPARVNWRAYKVGRAVPRKG